MLGIFSAPLRVLARFTEPIEMRRTRSSARRTKKQRPEKDETGQKNPLSNTNEYEKVDASSSLSESAGVVPELDSTSPLPSDPIMLRNGETVSVRDALRAYQFIKSAWEHHRGKFDAMVAALHGQQAADADAVRELSEANIILPNGTLDAEYRSVLESVAKAGVGGGEFPVPYHDDAVSRRTWEQELTLYKKRVDRFIRKLPEDDDDKPGLPRF